MGTALALQPQRSRKTEFERLANGPNLLPTRLLPPKKVVIEEGLWAELQELAEFHQATFKKMGSADKVSRTEVVDTFLRWAVEQFWKDRGGKPTNESDRDKKAGDYAAFLKKQQSKP